MFDDRNFLWQKLGGIVDRQLREVALLRKRREVFEEAAPALAHDVLSLGAQRSAFAPQAIALGLRPAQRFHEFTRLRPRALGSEIERFEARFGECPRFARHRRLVALDREQRASLLAFVEERSIADVPLPVEEREQGVPQPKQHRPAWRFGAHAGRNANFLGADRAFDACRFVLGQGEIGERSPCALPRGVHFAQRTFDLDIGLSARFLCASELQPCRVAGALRVGKLRFETRGQPIQLDRPVRSAPGEIILFARAKLRAVVRDVATPQVGRDRQSSTRAAEQPIADDGIEQGALARATFANHDDVEFLALEASLHAP